MWQIHLSTGGVGRIPVKDGMSLHPSPRLHTDCMRTGQSRKKQDVVESQTNSRVFVNAAMHFAVIWLW